MVLKEWHCGYPLASACMYTHMHIHPYKFTHICTHNHIQHRIPASRCHYGSFLLILIPPLCSGAYPRRPGGFRRRMCCTASHSFSWLCWSPELYSRPVASWMATCTCGRDKSACYCAASAAAIVLDWQFKGSQCKPQGLWSIGLRRWWLEGTVAF